MNYTQSQLKAIEHDQGNLVLFAVAGSGKTTVLVEKIKKWAAADRKQLILTFNKKAAEALLTRAGGVLKTHSFVGTFHSFCLAVIRKQAPSHYMGREMLQPREDWLKLKWAEEVLKVASGGDEPGLLATRVGRLKTYGFHPSTWSSQSDEIKRTLGISDGDLERAIDLQKVFDTNKKYTFDDMLVDCLMMMRTTPHIADTLQKHFDHILVDEFQDTDPCQAAILSHLSKGNLCVVGDDDQCCPPGTLVSMEGGDDCPIEELADGDRVLTYDQTHSTIIGRRSGYAIQVASRDYDGWLHNIELEHGHTYRATGNHRCLARWSAESKDQKWYCVYVMERHVAGRQDLRVGWCQLRRSDGCLHLAVRLRLEKGDSMCVLHTTQDPAEASLLESTVSARYGLPTVLFTETAGATHYTQENLDKYWEEIDLRKCARVGALEVDFNINLHHPLLQRDHSNRRGSTVFEIRPTNVLPHLMEMIIDNGTKLPTWKAVTSVTPERYTGLVYSLDVEKTHTFFANGVATHNSIYAFRGCSPKFIIDFEAHYGPAAKISMEENFRSEDQVLTHANSLISNNRDRVSKSLITTRGSHGIVTARETKDAVDEARIAVGIVEEHIKNGGRYADLAVLYRTNAQSGPFEDEMAERQIPFDVVDDRGGFYSRTEVKTLVNYLRILHDPHDLTALRWILNKPNRFLRNAWISECSQGLRPTVYETLTRMSRLGSRHQIEEALGLRQILQELAAEKESGTQPYGLVQKLWGALNYDRYLSELASRSLRPRSVDEYHDAANRFAHQTVPRFFDVGELLQHIDLVEAESQRKQEGRDAVLLSTVHRSKGMEFPVVIVSGLNEDLFPHQESAISEERRLAYVAVTRAIRSLHLLTYGKPSSFFSELGIDPIPLETDDELPNEDRTDAHLAATSDDARLPGDEVS